MRHDYDYQLRREIYELNRLRVDLAALKFMFKARQHYRQKANFDPSQPRVPRGYRDGGQWTDDGHGESAAGDRPVGPPPRNVLAASVDDGGTPRSDADNAGV